MTKSLLVTSAALLALTASILPAHAASKPKPNPQAMTSSKHAPGMFKLNIHTLHHIYYSGDAIDILVDKTNLTSKEINCWTAGSPGGWYRMQVVTGARQAEKSAELKEILHQPPPTAKYLRGSYGWNPCKPEETVQDRVRITSYFNMKEPGKYKVIFSQGTLPGRPAESLTVRSNTMVLTILPAPPTQPGTEQATDPPKITSITPRAWFAGVVTPITIRGKNFVPAATKYCGATQVTASVEQGRIKIDNVRIVSSTEITATIKPWESNPGGETTTTVINPPPNPEDVVNEADDSTESADASSEGGAETVASSDSTHPKPDFALSIVEDEDAARRTPALHRLLVKHTNLSHQGQWEEYYEGAHGMYNMLVTRDGEEVKETTAMWELRRYRKADNNPHIEPTKVFAERESWTEDLDVSDYYDMSEPGNYQVTVTREQYPLNPTYGVVVKSNSITVVVSPISGKSPSAAVPKPEPRFSLRIEKTSPDFLNSEISIIRRNITPNTIREFKCWSFPPPYRIFVTRNGRPITTGDQDSLKLDYTVTPNCPGNETLIEIEPRKTDGDDIPLTNYFNTEKPGTYQVYVIRETDPWNPAKSVSVKSNVLRFVVLPPKPRPARREHPVPILIP